MPSSPSRVPSGMKKRREKSSKKSKVAKRESHELTKSKAPVVKTETDENTETQSASNPNRGIFERFRRQEVGEPPRDERVILNINLKRDDREATTSEVAETVVQQNVCSNTAGDTQPAPPENYRNKPDVAKSSNESDTAAKMQSDLPQGIEKIALNPPQEPDGADQIESAGKTESQNDAGVAIPHSSTRHSAADVQQAQNNDDSSRVLPNQEEQGKVKSEESVQDGAPEKDAETSKCDEMRDVDQSTISADPTEKSHKKSGKKHKRKHKHSRKRSKSRDRSKSHKRRKGSEKFVPIHEQDDSESSGEEDQSQNGFDVEQARARIPKGCSVRHEAEQKQELRDGKKIAKTKKFTKVFRSTLEDHQLTALSWMVDRETDTLRSVDGGIIADKMGMGKTVTSLACIAANRLPRRDRKISAQATLVVVPNRTVANQWLAEAKKHWHEEASSLVTLHTQNDDDHLLAQYERQMIVLATYTQVRNCFPSEEIMGALHAQYADDDRRLLRREFKKRAKFLFRINWFRVIFDEGHMATKWNGRTLDACTRIPAKHRWVLSATPVQNKPIEFYSYATLVCCEYRGRRRVFRSEYIVKDATNDDFDSLASTLMYRRTGDEKLNIPPTTHQEVYIEISQEEQMICNAIDSFFKALEEKHKKDKEQAGMPIFENEQDEDEVEDVKPEEEDADEDDDDEDEGVVKKNKKSKIQASAHLRLRQALSHPYCLERLFLGNDLSEDELKSLASDLKSMSDNKTVIEQLEADENWAEHLGQYQKGLDLLKSREEAFLGGVFDMNKLMDLVILQRTVNVHKCGGAACESQNLSRFKCGHMYCEQCFGRLMIQRSSMPGAGQSGYLKCSSDGCGEDLRFGQPVTTLAQLAFMANQDKGYVEIGRDWLKTTVQARQEQSPFFIASSYFNGPRIVPPPSSRLTATMAVVMTWLTEAPQDKIIIFTQFIRTLKMVGYQLETLGIKFVYYSGASPKQKQEHAMHAFHNDPETMVMVSTLKSGGQSHNLTVANRVVIVDLWWNKEAEKQAIGRVVRIGQKKETFSVRIVTKHGMDDRVIRVQTGKEAMVARMLQDDGHKRTEVDDERLEQIFERKEGEEPRSRKRKRREDPFESRGGDDVAF
ncbi:SNF2 family N-terminal domain-containing protein [Trichoderma pleuroticola]